MSHKEKKLSAETHARHESENIQNDFWWKNDTTMIAAKLKDRRNSFLFMKLDLEKHFF